MDGPRSHRYGTRSGYDVRTRCVRGCTERIQGINPGQAESDRFPRTAALMSGRIEVKQESSCFGCQRTEPGGYRPVPPWRKAIPSCPCGAFHTRADPIAERFKPFKPQEEDNF